MQSRLIPAGQPVVELWLNPQALPAPQGHSYCCPQSGDSNNSTGKQNTRHINGITYLHQKLYAVVPCMHRGCIQIVKDLAIKMVNTIRLLVNISQATKVLFFIGIRKETKDNDLFYTHIAVTSRTRTFPVAAPGSDDKAARRVSLFFHLKRVRLRF